MARICNASAVCAGMGLTFQRLRASAIHFALPGTWVVGAPLGDSASARPRRRVLPSLKQVAEYGPTLHTLGVEACLMALPPGDVNMGWPNL